MCSSFTWGTVSVHYLLGLPLAYALRSATPNGLMLLVKLKYSPVMLRPIESFYPPRCFILSPSSFVHCVLFSSSPSRHTVLLYLPSFVCLVAVIIQHPYYVGCKQYGLHCRNLMTILLLRNKHLQLPQRHQHPKPKAKHGVKRNC